MRHTVTPTYWLWRRDASAIVVRGMLSARPHPILLLCAVIATTILARDAQHAPITNRRVRLHWNVRRGYIFVLALLLGYFGVCALISTLRVSTVVVAEDSMLEWGK